MPNLTTNYSFYLPLVNNATDADLWGNYLNDNWTSIDTILKTVQDTADDAAPLVSPTFTGDPKAPTPTFGDNDTSIATTAFVQAAIDAIPEINIITLTKTDAFTASLAASTWSSNVTGLSPSITPSSISSDVLVKLVLNVGANFTPTGGVLCRILRGATPIAISADGFSGGATVTAGTIAPIVVEFKDSPATAAPVTYNVQIQHNSVSTLNTYVNRSNGSSTVYGVSTFTLQEIS